MSARAIIILVARGAGALALVIFGLACTAASFGVIETGVTSVVTPLDGLAREWGLGPSVMHWAVGAAGVFSFVGAWVLLSGSD